MPSGPPAAGPSADCSLPTEEREMPQDQVETEAETIYYVVESHCSAACLFVYLPTSIHVSYIVRIAQKINDKVVDFDL